MTATTSLFDLIRARHHDNDGVRFDITPDWQQGRTTFGGLISTLAVQAMRDAVGRAWTPEVQLRALQTSFIGPVAAGAMQVRVQTLREGKNVRQIQATVWQNDQVAAILLGVFGSERATTLKDIEPVQPPAARGPDESPAPPPLPAGAPSFLHHIDTRWAEGGVPFSGDAHNHSRIFVRLRDEPEGAQLSDELLVVMLADVPPTPLLSHFTQRTPASSVSWELELRPLPKPAPVGGWWRIDTEALAAKGGYSNQISRLWAPGGQLAAFGYQVVTVYG